VVCLPSYAQLPRATASLDLFYEELHDVIAYVENDPAKSGLGDVKERWP
jgi:hypothetical protein